MSPRRLLSLSSVTGWTARITFLGCLLTMALLFTTHSEASVALRVDETRTRILLEHQPATVLLPVENLSSTPLQPEFISSYSIKLIRSEMFPGNRLFRSPYLSKLRVLYASVGKSWVAFLTQRSHREELLRTVMQKEMCYVER
jgi:hypothetical protein